MSTLLLKHADVLVTMDAERRRIVDVPPVDLRFARRCPREPVGDGERVSVPRRGAGDPGVVGARALANAHQQQHYAQGRRSLARLRSTPIMAGDVLLVTPESMV